MKRGQLVPDELTIQLVKERTAQDDCRNGYILDGFPRTPAQAQSLEKLAAEQGKEIVPMLIDVPLELLEKRMTGRRIARFAMRFTISISSRRATTTFAICILKHS